MAYQIGDKAKAIHERLEIFMEQHIYPREKDYDEFTSNHENLWQYPDWYEDLKKEAKKQELWNLFLPKEYAPWSPGLTNVEIAVLFETMSRSAWAQQVFNCNAPDRGNMEVLAKYGTPEQQKEWLDPLLDGKIRSAYAMTEPDVASSDATNMELEIKRDGDEYVLNGRKWWTTNVINPHCKIMLVMGKSNPGNSTVTILHSRSKNIDEICKKADILIVALGKANFVTSDMVKEGACIVDVGITRVPSDKTKSGWKLLGDVDFNGVSAKADYITPVPGGVGPMTIAMLLKNTLIASKS